MAPSDTNLKMLYAKRDRIFSRMQSISSQVRDMDSKSFNADAFLCDFETVDSLREDFEGVLDKIILLELKANPDYLVNYQPLTTFEDLLGCVKRAAKRLQSQSQTGDHVTLAGQHRIPKLPPIEIPEFNGDIKNWPLFISSFRNVVHNNTSLTDSEKLYYLIGKLTGRARSICAGITPSAENYSLIFDLLNSKYEDKRLSATAYLDQLFEFKPISSAKPSNLELFLDKFASSVAALKNLKVNDLSDFTFLHVALKKLDTDTARAFESYQSLNKKGCEIPLFVDLVSFVRDHIKVLERTSSVPKAANKGQFDSKLSSTQAYTSSSESTVCSLCHNKHDHIYKCRVFNSYKPNERFQFVKSNNLCINCLSRGHRVSACRSASLCKKCNSKHHTLLCFGNEPVASKAHSNARRTQSPGTRASAVARPSMPSSVGLNDMGIAPARVSTDDVTLCTLSKGYNRILRSPTTVLIATARVVIIDSRGREHCVRALLDGASQSNFVTRDCCRRLGLNINNRPACSVVKGIGGSSKTIQGSVEIKFYSRFDRNVNYTMESLVVDKITERLPTTTVDASLLSNFEDIALADDTYFNPGPIQLLIGASIFPHLLLSNKVRGRPSHASPIALETILGYVIVGDAPVRVASNESVSYCCTGDPLDSTIRKFWELEEVDVPSVLSPEDKMSEEFYTSTTTRDSDGRYVVALPFKGDVNTLGNSRQASENRFYCLERKMQASPQLKLAYDNIILEYLEKNYLSAVDCDSSDISYFIPHHGVIREDKVTTKLRVVLDGSCKTTTNVSLNDLLYRGQNFQGNLFHIIINFRLFPVALSADIRQMFLSIGVRESDRRFQRILYRFSPQQPLQVYEFNRVVFGLKSSPFHALRTIKQLAADEGVAYPRAREIIDTSLYMDDFVYSIPTEDVGISTASEMIGLMKAGQFELVKWTSNSQVVLDSIPPSHRLPGVKEFDESNQHKVLGLCWSPTSDNFCIKIDTPIEICTKRTILSCVAKIWDVMGFVAPVVLFVKLIIKQLWLSNCDWDDTPSEDIVKMWSRFKEELPLLSHIKIPRHVGMNVDSIATILGFADASEKAYGGVIYFHVQNNNDSTIRLITAKSKVSPKKVVSLARLELCAILILAQLIKNVVVACQNRIVFRNIFAFSDSTVALCWTHSSPHRWSTFVANRVTKIQSYLSPQNLYHVSGKDNPADCLSRGLTPSQIINHPLWFSGPPWAHLDVAQWPAVPFNPSVEPEAPEEKKQTFLAATLNEKYPILSLGDRISSWSKLLRSVVFVCRFVKLLPHRYRMSASDYEFAELLILRELQRFYFRAEIAKLKESQVCSPAFRHLKPFLKDGVIRVGGRLRNSDLSYDEKYPILLPRKDPILNLLVEYHHKLNCHAGPDLLMALLRQKYWILSARNLIRNRIHKCMPCFRLRPKPTFPEMADHRSCCVVQSAKPFIHTGTDYAGPFKVTITRGRGIRSTKAYVCLFVCMTTRAVHIELAGDLSTASFMGAFKRFLSRRGPVGRIYSDNGTNYIGAKRKLSELHEFLSSKYHNTEFGNVLAENRIDWSLNVPTASHFGGNWEANIKSLKSHLYRVIGDTILSFEELCTVLTQIESVMNTRPLCRTLSSDPSEPLALTPAHFLNLTPLKCLPAEEIDENLTTLARQISSIVLEALETGIPSYVAITPQMEHAGRSSRRRLGGDSD
ncbi:uncharacterized protein LOC101738759 [Bombyx mori]|uniref:uncharacterized protein LOC101738759 n=1 Tax=Bombyx mori TaxID=7091 RepID=UPI002ED11F90